ncbi:hypothetical protein WJX81_006337 [Elliptochloris bilobata]|uniref:Uncharacterized protein n=1 Tax=Elliptochloris bilobata TaxID=381761 RepID=A0AAW1RMK5_9CHLO
MFWRVAGFSQPSPLENILDKDDFTLEEVLDEEDLIQECKALNGRLIAFLKQPPVLGKLLGYLVDTPPLTAEDKVARRYPFAACEVLCCEMDVSALQDNLAVLGTAEDKVARRYPFAACEVLCCEVDAIFSALLDDPALLARLFGFLDAEGPLDCVRAGFFARSVTCLLMRRHADVMRYLQTAPGWLDHLVAHVDTTSIAEVTVRLVGADEQTAMYFSPAQFAWLPGTSVAAALLDKLAPGNSRDAQKNAAGVLAAIARSTMSPLTRAFTEPAFMARLLECAFGEDASLQALDVCIALLEPKPMAGEAYAPPPGVVGADTPLSLSELDAAVKAAAVQGVLGHLGRLVEMLEQGVGGPTAQETPFGLLEPPLGTARLKAVEVVAALLRLGSTSAEQGVREAGAAIKCLQLFLRFPFNNLLHHQVAGMVVSALESGSDEFLAHLFQEGQLIGWLTSAPSTVTPTPRPNDDRAGERKPLRAGYMGHISALANKMGEVGTRRPAVAEALRGSRAWGSWLQRVLRPRNELENVMRWACGRPSAADLAGADSDENELAGVPAEGAVWVAGENGGGWGSDDEEMAAALPGGGREVQSHRYAGFDDGDDDEEPAPAPDLLDEEDKAAQHISAASLGEEVYFTNAAAALRTLDLGAGAGAGAGASSSSSSSDDEIDGDGAPAAGQHGMRPVGLDDDSVVMVAEEDDAQRRARGAGAAAASAKPQAPANDGPFVSAFARVSSLPIPDPDPDPDPDSWEAFTDNSPRGGAAGEALVDDEEDSGEAAAAGGARCDPAGGAAAAAEDTGWASFPDPEPAAPAASNGGSGAAATPAPAAAEASGAQWPAAAAHSEPIAIPAAPGAAPEPEDPELAQFTAFSYWRAPLPTLADEPDDAGGAPVVLKEDVNSASGYSNLGNVHLQTGRAALALQDFSKAVGLAPEAPVPRLNRAIAEEQLGVEAAARGDIAAAERLYAAAVEDCEEAESLDPREFAAWFNQGNVQMRLGQFSGALASYRRAADLAPGIAGYRLREAELLFENDQAGDADRMLRTVLRKNPRYAEAHAALAAASLFCRREMERRSNGAAPRLPPPPLLRRKDLVLDALMGVVLFKALGGRFRSLLPSDLFWPGAMAMESLPAPSAKYAASEHRGELFRLFRRDGCHHCGQRAGKVVGDHIPPNKLVHGSKAVTGMMRQVERTLGVVSPVGRNSPVTPRGPLEKLQRTLERQLGVHARGRLAGEVQRFYPQCRTCSDRQAAAVKLDRRTLVSHFNGFRPPYAAAALVGLRHYQASSGYMWGFADEKLRHRER